MYDCVVPWSGGKDSTSIALKLKFEYGLNPLLVTFSPLILNECGQHNEQALIDLGFDAVLLDQITRLQSIIEEIFVERGNPKIAWDAGINSAPVKIALNFGTLYFMLNMVKVNTWPYFK